MKHLVGIMPLWDEERDSIWMLPGYMDGVEKAGGLPVIFPLTENREEVGQLSRMCDGFLFTGGQDVTPALYGEVPVDGLVETCSRRDSLEQMVLEEALKADKPVLGICRGIQLINAALGGTLYQDLPSQHPSEICHRQKAPYDVPVHDVTIVKGSPLCECLQAERISVNSCHHQAVRRPGPGLEVMAYAPDGITEAVYMRDKKFVWAMQWHPEFTWKTDPYSRMIFDAFVQAMG